MKSMTIFAASVFAATLAFSGANAAGTSSQGRAGSGGYGSSQGMGSQGSSGVGSQGDQGLSGLGAVQGDSGISPSGQAGSAGQIRQVQQKLSTMGYNPGNLNGELDAQTMEAIRNFQQSQGIQPSGQLDVPTLSALGVSGQPGDAQQYYGVSPEFDQSQGATPGTIRHSPDIQQQPGEPMDRQLDQGELQQRQIDQYTPQQPIPRGSMGQ